MTSNQLSLDLPTSLPKAVYDYGERTSGEAHGLVLTKPHVVALILDLSGYTPDKDLGSQSLLEPSCGHGAFVLQAAERLLTSADRFGRDLSNLGNAISAFDIEQQHIEITRCALSRLLRGHGASDALIERLLKQWLTCGDFLLATPKRRFEYVVGNPPYVRIEQIHPKLQDEYRSRYRSIYDRAGLYVAFIERGLDLLGPKGVLSFVCADRWIQNKYGAPLRGIISSRFSVRCYIDLHQASPFESDVIAYPSIFAISPEKPSRVQVGILKTASEDECRTAKQIIDAGKGGSAPGVRVSVYDSWFKDDEPWLVSTPAHLDALRDLEARCELIESGTTRVGIGVATGNDKLYIVGSDVDIEQDRLVPLVMRDDIERGRTKDGGHFVVNTFGPEGRVVDLARYPRLRHYVETNAADIKKRHVAQKNPNSWFRTIDRVYPELVRSPKLLIPDIAGSNEVACDEGHYHPHHNLYFIVSSDWDMQVLGGLISSKVALFFVWSYATKMRGGYLRFQAQYLRRIRVPNPASIPKPLANAIKAAFIARDFRRLDAIALEAYGLRELPPFDFVDTRR